MNIKKSFSLVCFFPFFLGLFFSLSAQDNEPSPILLDFDREQIDLAEFQRVYEKNNGGKEGVKDHTAEQYQEYLDLYINFKRKVFEAEEKGIHETESFKREFETYKKQLVEPYMSASEVEEQLIKEAFERSKYLINASHILLSLDKNALPNDTLLTYQKAIQIRDSILNGKKSFKQLAQTHSQDPSVKTNNGDLGFFSAFDMVYPFESAAFETPKGEVSLPVRTVFGYHLVKVNDKIPNSGKKRAAHIIIRVGDRYSAKDSAQAIDKIEELHEKLKNGADFAQLAKQFSDDPGTSAKGGDLGMIRLLPEMEEKKLALGEGEFSAPFQTAYGWHLLSVTEVEGTQDFESSKVNLKQRIARDSRSKLGQEALLKRIKEEGNYVAFPDNFQTFTETLDERFAAGGWTPDTSQQMVYELPLFKVTGKDAATLQELVDHYVANRRKYSRLPANQAVEIVRKDFEKTWLLAYEEEQLPKKNPEFRHLLKEYRDGIMLFTLMEDKVWKKAVEDTTGLRTYYNTHQEDFFAEQSVDMREYRCTTDSIAQAVVSLLQSEEDDDSIDSLLNQESSLNVRILTLNYEKGKAKLPKDVFDKEVGYTLDTVEEDGYFLVRVLKEKFPAGIKAFDKAKSEAITQYQDFLEKQWLEELEGKYPVTIHEEVFGQLFQ